MTASCIHRTTSGQATRIMPVGVASMMWWSTDLEPDGVTSNRCTPSRPVGVSNALTVIGESGIEAVAVEPIAAALGVTKGSFYWHFRTRRELVEAALQRWEHRATVDIIAGLAPIGDPQARLRALFAIAFLETPEDRIEDAILGAVADSSATAAVERVNSQRLGYLVQAFRDIGFPPSVARRRARISYATLLGHRRLQASLATRLSNPAIRQFGDELVRALVD